MAAKSKTYDWGGISLIVEEIRLATKAGMPGSTTTLSSTELEWLDAVVAGTSAASKAMVTDSSNNFDLGGTLDVAGACTFDTTTLQTGVLTCTADLDLNADIVGDGGGAVKGMNIDVLADGSTIAIPAASSGGVYVLDSGAQAVFTLPTAVVGLTYKFVVTVTTNVVTTVSTNTGDFFIGSVFQHDVDTTASEVATLADGSADDLITLNGTTTGGLPGSWFEVTAITDTLWMVQGHLMHSGSIADPFTAP